jgi:HEPN domain-containing protein
LAYGAAFHAQQCVEKYLKAILLRHNQMPPRTHDLGALVTLCENAGVTLLVPVEDLLLLGQFAVQIRYPGEELTMGEARSAVEIAERLRAEVRHILEFE